MVFYHTENMLIILRIWTSDFHTCKWTFQAICINKAQLDLLWDHIGIVKSYYKLKNEKNNSTIFLSKEDIKITK